MKLNIEKLNLLLGFAITIIVISSMADVSAQKGKAIAKTKDYRVTGSASWDERPVNSDNPFMSLRFHDTGTKAILGETTEIDFFSVSKEVSILTVIIDSVMIFLTSFAAYLLTRYKTIQDV